MRKRDNLPWRTVIEILAVAVKPSLSVALYAKVYTPGLGYVTLYTPLVTRLIVNPFGLLGLG